MEGPTYNNIYICNCGKGVALAPTEGGCRGAADPRVGANVTRPRFAWQAQ